MLQNILKLSQMDNVSNKIMREPPIPPVQPRAFLCSKRPFHLPLLELAPHADLIEILGDRLCTGHAGHFGSFTHDGIQKERD